jgi:hypothetical protein
MTIVQVRKKIALWLTLLLAVLVIFISTLGYEIVSTNNNLQKMYDKEKAAKNLFLQEALIIQQTYLNTIEKMWYNTILPSPHQGEVKETLLMAHLESMCETAKHSMIVAISDGTRIFFASCKSQNYEQYFVKIKDWSPVPLRGVRVLDGDINETFGDGDRIFLSSISFINEQKRYDVFVLFAEAIMYPTFLSSLDSDILKGTQQGLQNVIYGMGALIVIVFIGGASLIHFLRKLQIEVPSLIGDRIKDCPEEEKE